MLVEGRINPPPSTRQSVDLSSAAGVAVLLTPSKTPPPAAAAAATFPSIFSHLPLHHHHHISSPQRTEEGILELGIEKDFVPDAPFAWPSQRRTEQDQQQQCAQSTAPLSNITSSSSTRRTVQQRHSPWRIQCQALICKILTLFSSALIPPLAQPSQHFSTKTLASLRQTSTIRNSSSISRNQHSKKRSRTASSTATPTFSHRLSRPINIISIITVIFLLILTMGSVHCSSFNSHHQPSTHSTTTTSSSSSHSTSSPLNAGLIKHAEKLFFGQMGLHRAPTPPREAKVPQYMMDLYHWFRSNNHDRQMMLEEEDENSHPQYKASSHSSKAVIVALTGEDIAELSATNQVDEDEYEDEEEAKLIAAVNAHHRAPSRRRPSQRSRVALSGPASTVVGHKMNNHDHGRINRRRRRSVDHGSSPSSAVVDEAHLTFDVHLAAGQQLRGAELRLYRHAIFERREGEGRVEPKKLSLTANDQRPNHLYHWSVRYRLQHLNPSSSPSINTPTENNSHSSAEARNNSKSSSAESKGSSRSSSSHSSGEEYSEAEGERNFLQRINVHYLLRPFEELHPVTKGGQQQTRPVSKLIDTQIVDIREAGWLSFDIAAAVEHWVRRPAENFGLLVTFTDVAGRHQSTSSLSKLVVVNCEDSTHHHSAVQSTTTKTTGGNEQQDKIDPDHPWHEVQPLVITFSGKAEEEGKTVVQPKRVKRNNNNSSGGGQQSQQGQHHKRKSSSKRRRRPEKSHAAREVCSRKPMFFDFQAVGWMDWILAPPGFQAYYCQGRCEYPMAEHLNYTNHATIQALVNSVNFNLVPSPCCVPTELSPVTLLYYDTNNKVVLTNYHDMVVEGCGCR